MTQGLESHTDALQALAASSGITFGLTELDLAIRGCRLGDLSLIAGPPHGGKTQLAMHLALHAPEKRLLWFTPDESHGFLLQKLAAIHLGLAQHEVEALAKTPAGMQRLSCFTANLTNLKVSESGDSSEVKKAIEMAVREWGAAPQALVFDYADLLAHPMGETRMEAKMDYFKRLGKELGAAMVVIHQAIKAGMRDQGTPSLADMDTAGHKQATLVLWTRRTPTPRPSDVLREKLHPTMEVWVLKNKWQPMRPVAPIVLSLEAGGLLKGKAVELHH